MKEQRTHKELLEYLDKYGPVNTFRLSRELRIDRAKLIKIVRGLTKKGLTEFKSGVVTSLKKEQQESKKLEKEKPVKLAKPIPPVLETPKKSKILKEKQFELENVKGKIKRLKDNWLKKEEELKKEVEDLQTQINNLAQKLAKERALLYQIRKEKRETENNLIKWEKSLNQREEAVQKREGSTSAAAKRLKREKEKISKANVLKKDIYKLEVNLEELKKKISIEKGKLEKLKEKEIKPKAITRKTRKSKFKKIKPILKPKIEKPVGKIGVSKTETKKAEITPKELWQETTKIGKKKIEDKFHDLIEQEISLLKQKRIDEAKDIHIKIKDMISAITDPDQRKRIIRDWNRIKEFY